MRSALRAAIIASGSSAEFDSALVVVPSLIDMRAIVQNGYGDAADVLHLCEIDLPAVGDDEVLVRVRATSVHADVWHLVTGWPFIARIMAGGLRKPNVTVPGLDLAGQVERVGKNVTRFAPGDVVFGGPGLMHGWRNAGTFAEYAAIRQDALAMKPAVVTFEQAAAVAFSGEIAFLHLGPADQLAGRSVLINGAGGAVGGIAIQIAKAAGARVTGTDYAEKLAIVRLLGADHALDVRKHDCTQSSERYDLILDVSSTLSLRDCRRILGMHGIYVTLGHTDYGKVGGRILGTIPQMLRLMVRSPFDDNLRKLNFKMPSRQEILTSLKSLMEVGKLTPIIAKTFPLGEVPAAMRCLHDNMPGRVVITP